MVNIDENVDLVSGTEGRTIIKKSEGHFYMNQVLSV